MQLKCIAIDNEQWALDLIKKYVSKIPSLQLVQTMRDPEEACEFLKNNHVDLLFIDVNIPKGIELVGSLITRPITIFTTAYKKYALKGFEFGVLDYLLKPIDFDRFCKATGRRYSCLSTYNIQNTGKLSGLPFVPNARRYEYNLMK